MENKTAKNYPFYSARQRTRLPPTFLGMGRDFYLIKISGMGNLTTEHNFESQATRVIDVLCLFFDVIRGCLYNQALTDVRSTGAGIKYLFCSTSIMDLLFV